MNLIGDNIKKLRKQRNWTQQELSNRINVSKQVVSNWERNYSRPDHLDIANLSKAFGVSTDDILSLPSFDVNYTDTDIQQDASIDLIDLMESQYEVSIGERTLSDQDRLMIKDVIQRIFDRVYFPYTLKDKDKK